MKKMLCIGTLTAAAFLASGCLTAPVVPPPGLVVTAYSAPLDYTQERSPVSLKSGRSHTYSVIGLVALGDGSIRAAAEDGGLTQIYGADYEYFHILGVYQQYTTIVYGE